MNPAWSELSAPNVAPMALLESLRVAGAARFDAVGWHYIEALAKRSGGHSGPAQALLNEKLNKALVQFKRRLDAAPQPSSTARQAPSPSPSPSPFAALLSDMARHAPAVQGSLAAPAGPVLKTNAWRAESPKVQQFKKQLSQISVQKQVRQAIAQAPQNAGPINSHMLVLRSLGLMRDASADYLSRFMAHVDTLMCLEETGKASAPAKKAASPAKPKK
ncbi:DUF2894 domain-containing protein [Limnohabitans sp. Jir72]|uniref:DUF2894 domain-containing protein n=1 Tax=Limnohabitans sp. Jir72 TaxID=1977909 RepID=UPI000D33826C|nr:DUF2894 domain-containing protein [Limnohabitans sp. Jir72]PUE35943.1 hypothetical protein B9Z52_01935 [Limnohabitans sp. Jir72]